jgi:putative transposase
MRRILEAKARAPKTSQQLAERIRIVLRSLQGQLNRKTAEQMSVDPQRVSRWRRRWFEVQDRLQEAESNGATDKELEALVSFALSDRYRSGVKPKFTAEQIAQMIAVACEDPKESGFPVSHWTAKEVAVEVVRRGIVESISVRQLGRFLKGKRSPASHESLLDDFERQAGGPRGLWTGRREHLRNVPASVGAGTARRSRRQ